MNKLIPESVKQDKNSLVLSKQSLWLLVFCQFFNIVMIFEQLTTWMFAIILLCLCWRALMIVQEKSMPSKGVLVILAISGSVLLAITGQQLGLLGSMVHLLCFAYALKSLELKSIKDFYQLSLLGCFVLSAALIFLQSIYFSLLIIVLFMLNFALLISVFTYQLSLLEQYKQTTKIFIQSAPLAIILFVVFPKLPPFWNVPLAQSSITGISDNVKIGDVAKLALSDELAFRATFKQRAPAYSQLYWRTLVLDKFDGQSWLQNSSINVTTYQERDTDNDVVTRDDKIIQYQVIAEPSFQHWLFALDVASVKNAANRHLVQTEQYNLYSLIELTQAFSYQVESNLSMPLELSINAHQRAINLALPLSSNPKLTQEGRRLRAKYHTDDAIINAVITRFRQQEYYYSLQPSIINNNSLDQFYFETKNGFCEYYASSFTYLMRAAGIPARLVVGYLGGERNPNGDYYSVYQRDAHAWAEVWLPNEGWRRIDPTAAVSPERIESGFSDQLLRQQANYSTSLFSANTFKQLAILNNLRLQLQALDYQWTRWVVGYSAKKQYSLLTTWLGNIKPWKTAMVIGSVLIGMMLLLWLINYFQHQPKDKKRSLHQLKYQQALSLLEKKGLERPVSMSVTHFSQQVAIALPQVADSFERLSQCFMSLEYQELTVKQKQAILISFKTALLTFKKEIKAL